MLISSAIEDEFAFCSRKGTELQATRLTTEKRVVLGDLEWTLSCDRGDLGSECFDAFDAGFDFDVARHETPNVKLRGAALLRRPSRTPGWTKPLRGASRLI